MKITVRPVGVIRQFVTGGEIDAAEGVTPARLIHDLKIPTKLKMIAFIKGKSIPPDTILKEGDEVTLATMLGGG